VFCSSMLLFLFRVNLLFMTCLILELNSVIVSKFSLLVKNSFWLGLRCLDKCVINYHYGSS